MKPSSTKPQKTDKLFHEFLEASRQPAIYSDFGRAARAHYNENKEGKI